MPRGCSTGLPGHQGSGDTVEGENCNLLIDVGGVVNWFVQLVLSPSAYYDAAGSLVEEILSRVIEDIIALHDIPEVESHRLNKVCQALHPLEDLFMDEDDKVRKCS
jgi:hypothetical protein